MYPRDHVLLCLHPGTFQDQSHDGCVRWTFEPTMSQPVVQPCGTTLAKKKHFTCGCCGHLGTRGQLRRCRHTSVHEMYAPPHTLCRGRQTTAHTACHHTESKIDAHSPPPKRSHELPIHSTPSCTRRPLTPTYHDTVHVHTRGLCARKTIHPPCSL